MRSHFVILQSLGFSVESHTLDIQQYIIPPKKSYMATRSEGSQATSRAILVIAGILVLSALAYFAIKYFSEKADNEAKVEEINSLNAEVEQLEDNIVQFQKDLNDISVDLATKEQLLQQKVDELESVQANLAAARRANKTQTADIRKLELRVQELQSVLEEYDDLIAELRDENMELNTQVDSLVVRGSQMEERAIVAEQDRDRTREKLDRTVSVASALRARNITFYSFREGKKEKEFTTLARWRMKDLQICFTILDNQIAQRGDRTVYVAIEDAAGNPVTNFTDDISGRFRFEGQDLVYTMSKTVSFFGSEIEDCVVFAYPEGGRFEKGLYYVSIYSDNNLIGQQSFEID